MYGLREDLTAGVELPGLSLQEVWLDTNHAGNFPLLRYGLSDDSLGPTVVYVETLDDQVFGHRYADHAPARSHFDERCYKVTEIVIEGARAELAEPRTSPVTTDEDTCRDATAWAIDVYYGDIIVVVREARVESGASPNPYASASAMEQIARSLVRFQ